MIPTKEQAWDLLCEYNEGEFHRLHARIVGDVMRYFAVQLGYADEADFWQTVAGILHDLDFEQYPDQHCTKEAEILREKGVDEPALVHAVVSHGYLPDRRRRPARSTRWRRSSTPRTSSRASSAPSCGCCRRRVCRICSRQVPQEEVQGQEVCRRLLARGHRSAARCGHARLDARRTHGTDDRRHAGVSGCQWELRRCSSPCPAAWIPAWRQSF